MPDPRDALITGIGLLSCLGEGAAAHWQELNQTGFTPSLDTETFAPYVVHPVVKVELDKQIPKRGDQRTMEPWQRIGTYAAGLALDAAGIKGNAGHAFNAGNAGKIHRRSPTHGSRRRGGGIRC